MNEAPHEKKNGVLDKGAFPAEIERFYLQGFSGAPATA